MSEIEAKVIQKYTKVSTPKLIQRATKYFNLYIRHRDSHGDYFQCISCKEVKSIHQMNAGHYLSAGNNGPVRFDEDNVHGQCIRCNMHMSGNLLGYREGIIQKIGKDRVETIEKKSKMRGFRWDRFALIEIIETYKLKSK